MFERLTLVALAAFVWLAGAPVVAEAEAEGAARTECDAREPDVDPTTDPDGFQARDERNQRCALQRMSDEYTNPASGFTFWVEETPPLYFDNLQEQALEPTRPRVTLQQWIIGGRTTDPYRVPRRWEEAGRGQVQEVSFILDSGAKTRGYLFSPNPGDPAERLPGVVITTGSIQGYQEMYFWAAQALAEAGYVVLTYDVQGQGRGETFPHHPDGSFACDPADENALSQNQLLGCRGVVFQQGYNFQQGTRDALDFFLSTPADPYANRVPAASGANAAGTNPYNPLHARLDRGRIGLAGHSAGAGAVSLVGQERGCGNPAWQSEGRDGCVSAIVGWDAGGAPRGMPLSVPLLSLTAEYFFNPTSRSENPDPESGLASFKRLTCDEDEPADCAADVCLCDADDRNCTAGSPAALNPDGSCASGIVCAPGECTGVDAMRLAQRSSTHLEYSYVPYILPASRYGERVATYYTLAWFDRYLAGGAAAAPAFSRLDAAAFDGSADASSIGQGTFDPGRGANVPPEIEGDCTADRMSIYFTSRARLTDPDTPANVVERSDMRRELRDLCVPPEERG